FAARQGAGSVVPRQILGRGESRLPGRPTDPGRQRRWPGRSAALSPLARCFIPTGLGGLRQAALRRSPARVSLPGPLFPPRGRGEFPLADARARPGLFPVEGLCRPPAHQGHAAEGRRVYPTVPPPCVAKTVCPDSPLRTPGRS